MQEMKVMWVWSLGWECPVEEGMATHSSILVREIPLTEELDNLQFIGLQRVRHDWSKWACTHILEVIYSIFENILKAVIIVPMTFFNDVISGNKAKIFSRCFRVGEMFQSHERNIKSSITCFEISANLNAWLCLEYTWSV